METTTHTLKKFDNYRELFMWPALAALGLLLAEILLGQTRLRRLP